MFEKFTYAGAADFSQRYRHTYGYFTRRGNKTLVRLDAVEGGSVRFTDRDGLEYSLKADAEDDSTGFEFIVPKNSFHNTPTGNPVLLRRVAAKQYSRGVCDKNTAIETLSGRSMKLCFEALEVLYGEPVPVDKALDLMLSNGTKEAGVALSKQFAYWEAGKALKCFNTAIGSASYHKVTGFDIELYQPEMWRQEVSDLLRRSNLKGSVK